MLCFGIGISSHPASDGSYWVLRSDQSLLQPAVVLCFEQVELHLLEKHSPNFSLEKASV